MYHTRTYVEPAPPHLPQMTKFQQAAFLVNHTFNLIAIKHRPEIVQ